ncbi:MAG: 30S ribosomal protein S6e [Promethearchaeota archaeon CR_4]|nr:MAG: 30S ribosomal protein S6e [Candidatus Lokiarchaeota archaeon CR_4]
MSSKEKAMFKLNIGGGSLKGPGMGKTRQIQIPPDKFRLAGLKIGEEFNGALIGFPGYKFKITGGTDGSGIPMRRDVHGPVKKRIFLSRGPCYVPKRVGEKRWKVVRGNIVTDNMVQVNCVVMAYGETKLFEETPAEEKEGKAGKKGKAKKEEE